MTDDSKKSDRIEGVKAGLYSRNTRFSKDRASFSRRKYDIKSGWNDSRQEEEEDGFFERRKPKTKNFSEKILFIAVIFLMLSVGFVFLMVWLGNNKVSTENVDISVIGPSSMESGGEFSLKITVTNNNPINLEVADLVIKYPEGTYSASEPGKALRSERVSLGVVPSGRSIRKEVRSVLYGERNSDKDILISLEYRIADSNAIFFKERKYSINISSSPIDLIISPMERVISGQEMDFSVSVVSDSERSVESLLLVVEYPFGFKFISSEPKPTYGDNIWKMEGGSADKSVVKIKGIVSGQNEEERVFRFSAGNQDRKDEKEIGALFASLIKTISIEKPFIGVDIAVNGALSQEYSLSGNGTVRVDVIWANNSSTSIIGGEINIKLEGGILDKNTVSPGKGYYRSVDNTIIWNKSTNGELSEILPGANGRFSFSFKPLDVSERGNLVNPEARLTISAKGNRISEVGTQEEINSSVSKILRFSTDLRVTPNATYYSGPFVNSGPIPPEVETETTYTVTWAVTNTTNEAGGVRVVSSLPTYVRWMGVVSPNSEKITYNPVGGEVIWDVGDIKPGVGIVNNRKEISFQIAFLPSLTHLTLVPLLTGDVTITGTDKFTGDSLSNTKAGASTRLSTDPGAGYGHEFVR